MVKNPHMGVASFAASYFTLLFTHPPTYQWHPPIGEASQWKTDHCSSPSSWEFYGRGLRHQMTRSKPERVKKGTRRKRKRKRKRRKEWYTRSPRSTQGPRGVLRRVLHSYPGGRWSPCQIRILRAQKRGWRTLSQPCSQCQTSLLPGIRGSRTNTNAVRSVAYVLAGLDTDDKVQDIVDAVTDQLAGQLDATRDKALQAVGAAQEKVQEVTVQLREQIDGASGRLAEDIKAVTKGLSNNTAKLKETTASYRDVLKWAGPPNPNSMGGPQCTSLLDPRTQARERVKARQILIDLGTESDQVPPMEFTNISVPLLKRRIDEALEGCSEGDGSAVFKARAVTRLKNGGILMELGSDEAVQWFSHNNIQKKFLEGLHPDTAIKTRDFHIVVQFIPLTFKPDREVEIRELEESNRTEKGIIAWARWIKPISRRSPTQTCCHAIFSLKSPQAANSILTHGMVVHQKKVYAEKCKKEPLHCLKCHGWGHMARECSAAVDTCGTCAQGHRTDTCTNTARPHCVSCGTGGHASWDRACPIFQHKCREMNDRLEDNSMPYFPMEEAWTQVWEPPKVVYVGPPPPFPLRVPQEARGGAGMAQSTLNWQSTGSPKRGPPLPPQQDSWLAQNSQHARTAPSTPSSLHV